MGGRLIHRDALYTGKYGKYIVVNNIYQSHITLLLYRKHNSSIVQYVEHNINHQDIHIILGDFNKNHFNENKKPLNAMMNSSNYTQVVHKSYIYNFWESIGSYLY